MNQIAAASTGQAVNEVEVHLAQGAVTIEPESVNPPSLAAPPPPLCLRGRLSWRFDMVKFEGLATSSDFLNLDGWQSGLLRQS